jgi:pyrroloquinoline quinone biosynthesis protein D
MGDDVNISDKPAQNTDTAVRKIDDTFYVMHPDTSALHNFNDVGTRVWELVDGQRTVAEIAAVISGEYEVEPAVAETDILAFLDELLHKDLISV